MPDPQYNLTNPDWDHKEISDLQTATEMNQVIGAFKNNIVRLNALINLLNPDLALTTVAQTYSAAINELAVKLNLQWLNLANQYDVIPYPAMLKGQTRVCRIYEQGTNTEVENGWAIIGGSNGVKIGNKAMLICMQDSDGGTHAEVGYKYAIIGNIISKQQLITVADYAHLPDESDAIKDAIYLTLDTGNLYFWSAELSNFIQIGSIIEGTLISETEFKDTNNVVVVPDGTHIYKDQGSGVYYKWNGVKYEVFNQTGGGGTITDAMVILEDMYPGLGITQDWQRNQRTLNQAVVGKLETMDEDIDNAAKIKTIIIPLSAFDTDLETGDCQPITFTFDFKIKVCEISTGTAPTGAAIKVGIKKNGTDLSPTTRATIPVSAKTSLGQTPISLSTDEFLAGSTFQAYISQVGSSTPGKDLNMILTIELL